MPLHYDARVNYRTQQDIKCCYNCPHLITEEEYIFKCELAYDENEKDKREYRPTDPINVCDLFPGSMKDGKKK